MPAFRPSRSWDPRDGVEGADCGARVHDNTRAADAGEGERHPPRDLLAGEDEHRPSRELGSASPERTWGAPAARDDLVGPTGSGASGLRRREVPREEGEEALPALHHPPQPHRRPPPSSRLLRGRTRRPRHRRRRPPHRCHRTTTPVRSGRPPHGRASGHNPGSSPLSGGSWHSSSSRRSPGSAAPRRAGSSAPDIPRGNPPPLGGEGARHEAARDEVRLKGVGRSENPRVGEEQVSRHHQM